MNNQLLPRDPARAADRNTIAAAFGTDSLTTHRILQNCGWGFFSHLFGDQADEMWKAAHPFKYPAHDSRDFHTMDIEFIRAHFQSFAELQFWTGGPDWVERPTDQGPRMFVTYRSGYRIDPVNYEAAQAN